MSITDQAARAAQNLVDSRRAVLLKGGTVGATPAFNNLAREIESIPAGDVNYVLVEDTDTAYRKSILPGAAPLAKLKSIGGMTYKCNNLIPFPYAETTLTRGDITYTVNDDGSITANGTSTGSYFILSRNFTWGTTYADGHEKPYTVDGKTYADCMFNPGNNVLSINIASGVTVSNKTYYPMVNFGREALPFEKGYLGLRDTKVTAIRSHGANLFEGLMVNGAWLYGNGQYGSDAVNYVTNKNKIPIIGGAQYTLSFDFNGKGTMNGVLFYNADGALLSANSTVRENPYTFTAPNEASFLCFNVIETGLTVQDVEWVMLNLGTTAAPYKPYREPITYAIPEALQGTGKGVPGHNDTVDFERGKQITRVWAGLMPTNNWAYSESAGYFSNTLSNFNLPNANTQYRTASLCSEYSYGVDVEHCFWIDSSGKGLRVKDSRFTTVTEFQKYLNDNRVSVIYPLAEPIETDLPEKFTTPIEVEGGGEAEFVNADEIPVPSTITYIRRTT